MTKFFIVVTTILVVTSVAFSGYQLGNQLGGDTVAASALAVFGGLIGLAIVAFLVVFGAESKISNPTIVLSDDLWAGVYEGLGSGYYNGSYYHIVVPITDHKSEWTVDHPILVMAQCGSEIPQGKFTVSPAKKIIRPVASELRG